ncbi:hypothetical protein [Burkholderia plantarii]|uniref:hypothetical protein n=1 Tax=Burkholderia plantarii TaxID=41899 RepID=UPI0018DD5B1E|nr:hypothetical protein [Burkholderia plantarii]MBI0328809.1 hypothetical protein [Burkholderia plantarii]
MIGFSPGVERPGDLLYVAGTAVRHEGTVEVADRFGPKAVLLFAAAFDAREIGRAATSRGDPLGTAQAFPDATRMAAGDDDHGRPHAGRHSRSPGSGWPGG